MSVDLVYGYPAILIGLAVGLIAACRSWRITPILAVGTIVFTGLVLYQSTLPHQVSPEGNGGYTPAIWAMFVIVNAGSWALGIGMGVAVVGVTRRDVRV